MSIFDDWRKLKRVREANVAPGVSLPTRFYASCCYSDECKAFIETHRVQLQELLDRFAVQGKGEFKDAA